MRNELLILLVGLFSHSCTVSCDNERKKFIEQKACNIVVVKDESIGPICSLQGYNAVTKQKTVYEASAGIFYEINNHITVGDTLSKLAGSDCFLIKRKGYHLKISTQCAENGEAIGLRQDTTRRY